MENSDLQKRLQQTKPVQQFDLVYDINNENDTNQNVPVYLEFKSDEIYSYASEPTWQGHSSEDSKEIATKSSLKGVSPGESGETATKSTWQEHLAGESRGTASKSSLKVVSPNESGGTKSTCQRVSSGRNRGTASNHGESEVGTKNSGDTNALFSQNQHFPDVLLNLRESTVSVGTTYDQIGEPERKRVNKSFCSLGRFIIILTLSVILIAGLVLVYIFILNKKEDQGSGCNSIPVVINGEASRSSLAQESATVTVICNKGFRMNGSETMTCTNEVWTPRPKCVPVKCGALPDIEHGIVNGTSDDFNTTAKVLCDNGFFLESFDTIFCQADGSWSVPPSCVQHPCGNYTPEEDLLLIQDSGSSYSTLCFKCKPGLTFSNESDNCVTCQQGTWEGRLECEVQGVISFYPHQVHYNADDKVSLTCSVRDSPNWQSVGLARSDFNGLMVEPLYNVLNSAGKIEVNRLSNGSIFNVSYDVEDDGVTLVLTIESARCKDSGIYICGNIIGKIDAADKVKTTNTSIHVRAHADVPEWKQFPDDIIPGSNELFKCSAEIGDPKGYIDIESNLDGNFSILLTTKLTQDSNDIGYINYFTDMETNCGNNRLVVFSLKNVTSRYHQKELRCVSRNSEYPLNARSAASDTRSLQVLPDDFCRMGDTIRSHPYHCDRFILCSLGKVAGIPAGCGDNECFNNKDNTCYPCDQLGGCSITDIYIDGYSGWIIEGSAATLICKVNDFEGLTDIMITKGNSSVNLKLSDQETEPGISYLSEQSYIDGPSGQLTFRIDSVQCKDEGKYHCSPIGAGKYSEDETSLALKDSSGNTVC